MVQGVTDTFGGRIKILSDAQTDNQTGNIDEHSRVDRSHRTHASIFLSNCSYCPRARTRDDKWLTCKLGWKRSGRSWMSQQETTSCQSDNIFCHLCAIWCQPRFSRSNAQDLGKTFRTSQARRKYPMTSTRFNSTK